MGGNSILWELTSFEKGNPKRFARVAFLNVKAISFQTEAIFVFISAVKNDKIIIEKK